jgi:hypothetical protein
MLSKYFFTATKKITAHAQNFLATLLDFDFKYLLGGLSELKILVSVVRFRPGPPRFYKPPSGGFFIGLSWIGYLIIRCP